MRLKLVAVTTPAGREAACPPALVPAGLAAHVQGCAWARDTVGESGGTVYRLHGKPGAPDLFLKHGTGAVAEDVTDEMVRLLWLGGRVPVPSVVHFTRTAAEAWLLMTAIPGRTVFQVLEEDAAGRHNAVAAMARFLRRLHSLPIQACPFNADHAFRLMRARERIDTGLVDTDEFDDERRGWTAEQVWGELMALLPLAPDPVVTHGDFSLDNILLQGGEAIGCIDVGRVGIADRWQDLAVLWHCLGEFDASLRDTLLATYGLSAADERKLRFHLLLDELF